MLFNGALAYVYGIIMYTEAILVDIKSLFDRIDKETGAKESNAELSMLEYFEEAIELHLQFFK